MSQMNSDGDTIVPLVSTGFFLAESNEQKTMTNSSFWRSLSQIHFEITAVPLLYYGFWLEMV